MTISLTEINPETGDRSETSCKLDLNENMRVLTFFEQTFFTNLKHSLAISECVVYDSKNKKYYASDERKTRATLLYN